MPLLTLPMDLDAAARAGPPLISLISVLRKLPSRTQLGVHDNLVLPEVPCALALIAAVLHWAYVGLVAVACPLVLGRLCLIPLHSPCLRLRAFGDWRLNCTFASRTDGDWRPSSILLWRNHGDWRPSLRFVGAGAGDWRPIAMLLQG